jgi:hypothetical protein
MVGGTERSVISEQLEELPPGRQLAALVESVDRSDLDSDDLLRLAQARQRLVAHQEAQLIADLHAVARAVPYQGRQPGRRDLPGRYPWAECDVAFALRWTYGRAAAQLIFADEVIDRLPRIHAALSAGVIDVPKARVLVDGVDGLDDTLAVAIVDKLIDVAPRLTTGELRARLRRLVIAADADHAARRARVDINDRRVQAYLNDNNLAALAGYELAPHRVAAVMERLDAIAKAAKSAGDGRRMDQLRADAFLDLLVGDGVAAGGPISDSGLDPLPAADDRAAPATGAPGVPWPAAPTDPVAGSPPQSDPVAGSPPQSDPVAGSPPQSDPVAGSPPQSDPGAGVDRMVAPLSDPSEPADEVGCELVMDQDEADRARFWLAGFDQLATTRGCPRCGAGTATAPAGAMPGPRPGVVELQVPLTTLMGMSQLPGELAGWGPVFADLARQVASQMNDAQWRFSIYDQLNELSYHGTTTARPDAGGHRTKRRPTAKDIAFVKARDRTCRAPGCRRPARRCDIDHTLAWVHGGESESCNLGLLCRLHHLFKHSTGCHLTWFPPSGYGWTTPLGMQYVTAPDRPLVDENATAGLPEPAPTGVERAG